MLIKNFLLISFASVLLITAIAVLIFLNKQIKKEILIQKERLNKHKNNFRKIIKSNEKIEPLSELAKEFFKEEYEFPKNLSYLELAKKFKKKNKPRQTEFCNLMSEALYSGNKMNQNQIERLMMLFDSILIQH
jgi:hypothetical protein